MSDLEKIDKHPSGTWRKINRHVSGAERYVYSTDEGQSWAPRKGGAIPPQPTPADSDPGLATVTDDVYAGLSAEERAWADRPAVDPDAPPAASPEPERVDPAISVPLDAAPKPAAGRELDMWETLAKYAPGQDTQDAIAGAVAGGGFGWGEELGAGLLEMLPDPEGYDRSQRGDVKANMLRQMRKEDAQAQERSPYLYGGAAIASQIPMAIATQGALPAGTGAGARMLAGGLEGTVQGMVTGAGMANEGDRGEGARIGGAYGGLGGAAIPGLGVAGGMARKGAGKLVDAAKDLQVTAAQKLAPGASRRATAGAPEELREVAEEVATSPQARQALLRADRQTGEATTEIAGALTRAEKATDAIMTHAKLRLKRAPVVRGLEADAVDPDMAMLESAEKFDEVADMLDDIAGDAIDSGRGAMKRLAKGTKLQPSRVAAARTKLEEALNYGDHEGAGDVFMALDQFKRDIGKAVRTSGRGNADPNTEERLKAAYMAIQDLLQDDGVWGQSAAGVQREVNAAWVPWIRKDKGMQRAFMSDIRGEVAEDPWSVRSEGDPAKIKGLLSSAGDEGNALQEQALREGIDASANIADALSRHYDVPTSVARLAEDAQAASRTVSANLDQVIGDAKVARSMADVSAEAIANPPGSGIVTSLPGVKQTVQALEGSPAANMRRLGRMEEAQATRRAAPRPEPAPERMLTEPQAVRAGMSTATGVATGADKVRELGRTANSTSDAIEQLVTTDPYALEDWGPRLAEAKQRGNFAAEFSKMQQTDPQFRQRVQQLEQEMFQ